MDEYQQAIAAARDYLFNGQAVELHVLVGFKNPMPTRLVLIPSAAYAGRAGELLIVLERRGSYFWDGREALDEFQLISAGFPHGIAIKVAQFVGMLMLKCRTRLRSPELNAPLNSRVLCLHN